MAWDKDLPSGSNSIAQLDNDVRANNAAAETALDLEHRFATGGNQSGRHTFVVDTTANIGALADVDTGSIALSTDERTGKLSLMAYRSGAFEAVDSGVTDICRLDEVGNFTGALHTAWSVLTISASAVSIDAATFPYKAVVANQNFTISNPDGISALATSILLAIQMDGTGGHTISFGSAYRAPGGVVPIDTTANAQTLLYLTKMPTNTWLVTSIPNWNTAIT